VRNFSICLKLLKNRPSGAKAVTAKFSNTGKYTKLKNVEEKREQELLLDLAAQLAWPGFPDQLSTKLVRQLNHTDIASAAVRNKLAFWRLKTSLLSSSLMIESKKHFRKEG
jgi:hypothetical protein